MFNPLGAGVRWAVHLGGAGLGDTVLILGAGQRGLAAVLAARTAGSGTIIVTGLSRDAGKLALARQADVLSRAAGAFGSSADYLERARVSLITHGIVDPYLEALALQVAARLKQAAPVAAPAKAPPRRPHSRGG
jgi:threonine dehydrogenase-like Zn-dependent dehydrogenase